MAWRIPAAVDLSRTIKDDGHMLSSPQPEILTFTLDTHAARLDAWLATACPTISRSRWKQLIEAGHVQLNGAPILKPKTSLAPSDKLTCALPAPVTTELLPANIPLAILYEDSDLIAINKPAGLVVHPAPGHAAHTLVNALLHHCGDLQGIGGELRPGIVHRLDKDTSGVLVVAKNEHTHAALVAQFASKKVKKEYLALVWGQPEQPTGTIDLPIGRHPVHRKKMAVTEKGRPALTRYETVARGPLASLLRVHIETGRTHQIRVHLSRLGHPVVGDTTYGRARHGLPEGLRIARQMLHAYQLQITHPRTGRAKTFTAEPPADFLAAQKILTGGG
ncbi:MAG TPA: RluA family pseudouridine synthase [Kiritimatiellia bacterium]|jgi:23S rRNA pseudouridine1911/1915/1917 synthase|nr:RluA family pseudouridine synthase [Kiritimatiellia bacterium]